MTIPRLLAMHEYWAENPPVHEVVLAIGKGFGLEKKSAPATNSAAAEDSGQQFLRDFMAAGGAVPAELMQGGVLSVG